MQKATKPYVDGDFKIQYSSFVGKYRVFKWDAPLYVGGVGYWDIQKSFYSLWSARRYVKRCIREQKIVNNPEFWRA